MIKIQYLNTDTIPEIVYKNKQNILFLELGIGSIDAMKIAITGNHQEIEKIKKAVQNNSQLINGNIAVINRHTLELQNLKNKGTFKGTYATKADMVLAIPNAIKGDYALVGSKAPFQEWIFDLIWEQAGSSSGVSASFGDGTDTMTQPKAMTDKDFQNLSDIMQILSGTGAVPSGNPWMNKTWDNAKGIEPANKGKFIAVNQAGDGVEFKESITEDKVKEITNEVLKKDYEVIHTFTFKDEEIVISPNNLINDYILCGDYRTVKFSIVSKYIELIANDHIEERSLSVSVTKTGHYKVWKLPKGGYIKLLRRKGVS